MLFLAVVLSISVMWLVEKVWISCHSRDWLTRLSLTVKLLDSTQLFLLVQSDMEPAW